jgi:hypothetical protein
LIQAVSPLTTRPKYPRLRSALHNTTQRRLDTSSVHTRLFAAERKGLWFETCDSAVRRPSLVHAAVLNTEMSCSLQLVWQWAGNGKTGGWSWTHEDTVHSTDTYRMCQVHALMRHG